MLDGEELKMLMGENHQEMKRLIAAIGLSSRLVKAGRDDEGADLVIEAALTFKAHCFMTAFAIALSYKNLDLTDAQKGQLAVLMAFFLQKTVKHEARLCTLGKGFADDLAAKEAN